MAYRSERPRAGISQGSDPDAQHTEERRRSAPERKYRQVKSPATVEDQIEKLRSRGCVIEDMDHAVCALSNINYYRLAHYFAIFLETKTRYREGTSFEAVMHIYDFDRLIRSLLLMALEEVEITMRANVSNYHALKYGALGYLNSSSFDDRHNHKAFLKRIDRMIENNTGEQLVTHHMKKYGGAFPLWVIMELFSFGTLNTFFHDMKAEDKRAISENAFGLPYRSVENWLNCLSELRNNCAHYNRLYAVTLSSVPKQPPDIQRPMSNTLFDYILILKRLYPRSDVWNTAFAAKLNLLIAEYSEVIELPYIGFPDNWQDYLFDDEDDNKKSS
ncbi:MAG: Abi family protein [Ruminiclostridium sp.]|nr:Abi family protein [Ruminiclostridium sp.]